MKILRAALAAAALALGAGVASAQQATDYSISQSTVGSRYELPPSNATTLVAVNGAGLSSGVGDDGWVSVNLPFTFKYFGSAKTSCDITTNGCITFGAGSLEWKNSSFPLSTPDYTTDSLADTMCAYFDDLVVGNYRGQTGNNGTIKAWTAGTAPFRRYVVTWEGVFNLGSDPPGTGADGQGPFSFQIQLYETTGAIVFSYASGGTFPDGTAGGGYTLGIEAADARYEFPSSVQNSATANVGAPPYDFEFDPPAVTFTGTVLYDRYVVDASGIGNSSEQNLPLAGMLVEALDGTGAVVGAATTGSTGAFAIATYQVPTTTVGSIVVVAQNASCAVRATSAGAPYVATAASNVSYAQNLALGTLTLREGTDSGGVARAPINVARTIQQVVDWAKTRTTDAIPFLDVLYDTTSSLPTSYTAASGTTAASMRVSGASANPDPWDVSVIRKTYARHVLGAIAASPTDPFNSAFDAASTADNAFAEGFGYYLDAAVSGGLAFYDGISSSASNAVDVESAAGLHSAKSATVAAWVAAALHDLLDPANEDWDTFDGSGTAGEQVFRVVDSLSSPVTASSFYSAWLAAGFDARSITEDFIYHGLLVDDAEEPNDDVAHATPLSQFGIILTNRVLNLYNEDWYAFTLPEPTDSLTVSVVYDRSTYASVSLTVELTDASGSAVATAHPVGSTGPVQAVTGPLPAGAYRVRVALAAGGPLPSYTLQAFSQLEFTSDAFQPWTVGRPYSVPVSIKGGIPAYGLTVSAPYQIPDGLQFDVANARVAGTPSGPAGGLRGGSYTYSFLLKVVDSASPQNTVSKLLAFTLNDVVRPRLGDYTTFALGKPVDRAWPAAGGTAPYALTVDQGALPHGLSAHDGADLRFVGTPDAPGRSDFKMTVTDVAGSSAAASARGVVCVPAGPADLAAGDAACGFYFDALQGSSVGLTVTTAKKSPVRALRTALVDTDGNTALSAAKVRPGNGKASFAGFVPQTTGRFYCVVASDAGDATSLLGKLKIVAPKAGSGADGASSFGEDQTLEIPIPALAGATLSFSTKVDKSGLQLAAVELRDPSGAVVAFGPADVKVKKGAVSVKTTLPVAGVWTLVIGAQNGPSGHFTYKYSIKQPPKAVYSAD